MQGHSGEEGRGLVGRGQWGWSPRDQTWSLGCEGCNRDFWCGRKLGLAGDSTATTLFWAWFLMCATLGLKLGVTEEMGPSTVWFLRLQPAGPERPVGGRGPLSVCGGGAEAGDQGKSQWAWPPALSLTRCRLAQDCPCTPSVSARHWLFALASERG